MYGTLLVNQEHLSLTDYVHDFISLLFLSYLRLVMMRFDNIHVSIVSKMLQIFGVVETKPHKCRIQKFN
jgi:hypothetical protein